MDIKEKVDEVHDVVDEIIKIFNEKDLKPDVAMAVGGQLFSIVCRDCGLGADQFLYLCQGIADKNKWPEREKNEEAKQKQPSGRESGNETRKGKREKASV